MNLNHYSQTNLPTKFGDFQFHVFRSASNDEIACLSLGIEDAELPDEHIFVRIHSECKTGEIFGSLKCDCGDQLDTALKTVQKLGRGLVVYLNQEGRGVGLGEKIRAYKLQEQGADTVEANVALGLGVDQRTYDDAIEILNFFKIKKVDLNSNNPLKIKALKDSGFDVMRTPSIMKTNEHSEKYLQTKKEKCGHLLD
jgi:3,4-dihydroxy 2-butanone 4-phosphate synthase/GTP cyclohydrolase II